MLGQDLPADAWKVAEDSSGFLRFGRITVEKQRVLDQIRDTLDQS